MMIDPLHMKITDNYITVNRQHVDLYEVISWTKKNCPHYITNQYHMYNNIIIHDLIDFFFLDYPGAKKDMSWFILRWS